MEVVLEQAMLWVTVIGIIIIPLVGTIINNLITKKIDALETGRDEDKKTFFTRLDDIKMTYVRKDLYDQALQFHQKEIDTKFLNLVETVNKNFLSVETDIKDVKGDIKEVKDLINSKFQKES